MHVTYLNMDKLLLVNEGFGQMLNLCRCTFAVGLDGDLLDGRWCSQVVHFAWESNTWPNCDVLAITRMEKRVFKRWCCLNS